MKIEVLHATGCANCLRDLTALRAAALQANPAVEWHELDVLQAIDYAVELGVLKPPAVAIDGALAFLSLPTPEALIAEIRKRLDAAT